MNIDKCETWIREVFEDEGNVGNATVGSKSWDVGLSWS